MRIATTSDVYGKLGIDRMSERRIGLQAFSIAVLLALGGCDEVDDHLDASEAHRSFQWVVKHDPSRGVLIYSWHHCCYQTSSGSNPYSRCIVYSFGRQEFLQIVSRQYPIYRYSADDMKCWSPKTIKGCSDFDAVPFYGQALNLRLLGSTCGGPFGDSIKVDDEKGVVVVEIYDYGP